MSCITMILNCVFSCKLFKNNKKFNKRQIVRLKYCKWCRYKFKQDLTLAIQVWTCYSIDTAVKCWKESLKLVNMISAQWLWVFFFIYPHSCKVQCCMGIALISKDVAKHLMLGGEDFTWNLNFNVKNLPEV
jgi:hypothetical protein